MGNIWQIAVIVIVAIVLIPAANVAYTDQANATTVTERITVDHGSTTPVDNQTAAYDPDVTIEDVSAGETLSAGTDYEWQQSFGTVYWPESGDTTDGETLNITYTYYESDPTTDGVTTIMGSVGWLIGILVFLTIMATLLAWLGLTPGGGW